MHTHDKINIYIYLKTHSRACRYLTSYYFFCLLPKDIHTFNFLLPLPPFKHSVPEWYPSPSTSHATLESARDTTLCVCVCPSVHTNAPVNRIEVSVQTTTPPTQTPACLWLCVGGMTGRQLCRKTFFHVSAAQSVYDSVAWAKNTE